MITDRSSWAPILTGSLRTEAMACIEAIASELQQPDVLPSSSISLARGSAGAALFFAALSHAQPEHREGFSETALQLLERSVATTAAQSMTAALYGGFTGIAWVVEHLHGRLYDLEEAEDPNTGIDAVLADYVTQVPWKKSFDVIGGLVGYGLYALERKRLPAAMTILESVVERLRETAVVKPKGVTWHTSPDLLQQWQRDLYPRGYYNLGVAHGTPGVIAFLAQVCGAGVALKTARPLLDDAVSWLLSQENADRSRSCFATAVTDENGRHPYARLAWCYGDLGIAASLLWAARSAGESTWEREAIRIATHAAGRTFEQSGVVDAGLCHGAAGNAHLFNRIYQATRDEIFLEAARTWFERTLALRKPGSGVAGFLSWDAKDGGTWLRDPGLLEGAVGIGLALLAAVDSLPPDWDRIFLVSVPPK